MHRTLRFKILFYLLVVSLCGIFITSFTIFFGVENHFSNYLQKDREKNVELIRQELIEEYQNNGSLEANSLMDLFHDQAMTEDLYYEVYDNNDNLLINTTRMLGMMNGMNGMHGETQIELDYQSYTVDLTINEESIGYIKVFYPEELIGEDFTFLKSIQKNIIVAVIVTIVISVLFSLFFSRRLTTGFDQLSKAIERLRKHKYKAHVSVEELTPELRKLGESFNQLATSLVKEEDLRKQFTADFAHELRTPLATLRSQIEAYQDEIWEPTPIRLQQSHDELMRLVRLVNELEKLIAAENPQIKLQKSNLEAGQLARQVADQFLPLFNEKGVELIVYKPDEEHSFLADRDKVIQIVSNILKNALNYTAANDKVSIEIKNRNGYLGFVIKDQGIGIGEADIPFLFERFYRGDKSRDRKTGGIGIGLSIVKALVDAHDGEIKIESELNMGTTVTIWFPKVK